MTETLFVEAMPAAHDLRGIVSEIRKRMWSRLTLADQDALLSEFESLGWALQDLVDSVTSGKWRPDGSPVAKDRSPTIRVELRVGRTYAAAVATP